VGGEEEKGEKGKQKIGERDVKESLLHFCTFVRGGIFVISGP